MNQREITEERSGKAILEGLSPEQEEVAHHGDGPLLVLAVAGSGKTRAIAHRAAYLVAAHGVMHSRILCLTFTNKAAGEMRERIGQLLDGRLVGITIATFHSLCARLLRVHHRLIKRSRRFVIYDEEDIRRLAREVAKDLGVEGSWEQLLSEIGRLKSCGVLPEADLAQILKTYDPESPYVKLLNQAYHLYERKLARYDALDFTDLLLKTIVMLEQNPAVLDHIRHQYRYLLVDEYQDTCPLQERLLRLLSAPAHNLCVVGDDDQAIYSFRHADVSGILTFEARYPGAKVVRMEENYRSTGSIIEVARKTISANQRRHPKSIHTVNGHGLPVEVVGFASEEQEAAWIAKKLQELNAQGLRYGEIAILCRVASLFRPVERELARTLIPYVLVDGLAFWERREVKDLMAYLRFIHNPLDYLSFKRIANVPPRGLGKKAMGRIEQRLKNDPDVSLTEILEGIKAYSPKLCSFLNQIESLRKEQLSINALIERISDRLGYESYLMKSFPDAMRRLGHLMQLVAIAKRFDRDQCSTASAADTESGEGGLSEFLLQAGLSATGQDGEEGRKDSVRLMTIHAAKGLEFRGVFVVGLEDGILPHARCREQLEEERRLFYVAVTRARERLFLSWSTRRMLQGREMNYLRSPFVKEILPWHTGYSPESAVPHNGHESVICYSPSVPRSSGCRVSAP